jgi:hypothetical protein
MVIGGGSVGVESSGTVTPGARPMELRLARVHLRMGALELARAELESFAGRGVLDAPALLDLAEVRWRTGDLPGAGVAASAYLGTDDTGVLALVIAAEAAAAVGHPGDARRLAQEALERIEEALAIGDPAAAGIGEVIERPDGAAVPPVSGGPEADAARGGGSPRAGGGSPRAGGSSRTEALSGAEVLDTLFAGMPQSQVWPMRPHFRVEPTGLLFVTPLQSGRRAAGQAPVETERAADASERGGETGSVDRWVGADAPAFGSPAARSGPTGDAGQAVPDDASGTPGLWGDDAPAGAASDAAPMAHPELTEARAALEAGDATSAAARLSDLLRRRPDLAGSVLAAIADDGAGTDPADRGAGPSGPGAAAASLAAGDDLVPRPAARPPDPIAEARLGDDPEQERP